MSSFVINYKLKWRDHNLPNKMVGGKLSLLAGWQEYKTRNSFCLYVNDTPTMDTSLRARIVLPYSPVTVSLGIHSNKLKIYVHTNAGI